MVSIQQLKNGVQKYAEYDLVPNMPEMTKVIVCGTVALFSNRAEDIAKGLQENPVIAAANVIHDDMVDIEALYNSFAPQIKETMEIKIPLVGKVGFDRTEVDKLYRRIME